MTDVEEPTANINPTIDAQCPVQLAERGIVWVCAPRIEEGWEEVQSVRKAAGVGVGECGVAPRKKASIDEALHGGNQGVVRNAEVCFAVTSPDSLLRLLAVGWLVGVACFATTPTGLLGCHFHVRPSSWTRCGIDSLHTFGSCCILYIIRSPFLHLSEDVQIMSSGLIATTSSPPSHCRLKTSRLSPKWSSQVRGTSKRACLSQTASTPTPPSPTTHPRPRKTHQLRTPSHIPSSTPSPSPSSTTPITPPLTHPPHRPPPHPTPSAAPEGTSKKRSGPRPRGSQAAPGSSSRQKPARAAGRGPLSASTTSCASGAEASGACAAIWRRGGRGTSVWCGGQRCRGRMRRGGGGTWGGGVGSVGLCWEGCSVGLY